MCTTAFSWYVVKSVVFVTIDMKNGLIQVKTEHEERIRKRLKEVGVTWYGMMKFATHYLANVIHEDEHIGGVVYGRYKSEKGTAPLNEGMLIATDRRVVFLDHKPGFTDTKEITYDVVSGIQKTTALFSGVILKTRLGDYTMRFTNNRCANIFIEYVESRRLEETKGEEGETRPSKTSYASSEEKVEIDGAGRKFMLSHEVAILSTVDRSGNAAGAVVYYYAGEDGFVYILTKGGTQKAHNIYAHKQVAVTIFDENSLQTLQLQGTAATETNPEMRQLVFSQIVKERQYGNEKRLPPVTKQKEGAFMIIKITPTSAKFHDYKKDD